LKYARALPIFSAAFAVLYAAAMYFNIAMFVYYPQPREFHWHDQAGLPGPAMYWYGWIAYALLGATVLAALGAMLPARWSARISSHWSWGVPLAAMLFILYVIRDWFIR
jgi:hypothetical protein